MNRELLRALDCQSPLALSPSFNIVPVLYRHYCDFGMWGLIYKKAEATTALEGTGEVQNTYRMLNTRKKLFQAKLQGCVLNKLLCSSLPHL